jgi:hypothetical protein
MKKFIFIVSCFLLVQSVFAQEETKPSSKKKFNIGSRPNDHFMIQLGITNWAGKPDSIHTKGLSRSFNAYFMFDFPFKTNPRLSVGIGAGVGTDNIYFSKTYVGIKDLTPTLQFQDLSDTNHFKKYKLATTWLEAPLELRFSSNPSTPNKTYKAAIGIKLGTLVNAHTKGKTWVDSARQTLIPYTEKQTSKRFYNSNRFVATARVGYGVFTLFGTYQLNTLFKEGFAPDIRPWTMGLTISGL